MQCFGRNNDDHCCYIKNEPCPFLEENVDGNRWSCQLRRETGSWDAAILDPRYNTGEGSPGHRFAQMPYKNCRDYQCTKCGKLESGEWNQVEFDASWQ